jgi:hypothetical protein
VVVVAGGLLDEVGDVGVDGLTGGFSPVGGFSVVGGVVVVGGVDGGLVCVGGSVGPGSVGHGHSQMVTLRASVAEPSVAETCSCFRLGDSSGHGSASTRSTTFRVSPGATSAVEVQVVAPFAEHFRSCDDHFTSAGWSTVSVTGRELVPVLRTFTSTIG